MSIRMSSRRLSVCARPRSVTNPSGFRALALSVSLSTLDGVLASDTVQDALSQVLPRRNSKFSHFSTVSTMPTRRPTSSSAAEKPHVPPLHLFHGHPHNDASTPTTDSMNNYCSTPRAVSLIMLAPLPTASIQLTSSSSTHALGIIDAAEFVQRHSTISSVILPRTSRISSASHKDMAIGRTNSRPRESIPASLRASCAIGQSSLSVDSSRPPPPPRSPSVPVPESPIARMRRAPSPTHIPPMRVNTTKSQYTLDVQLPDGLAPEMVTVSAKRVVGWQWSLICGIRNTTLIMNGR
ncbi:hypothetical protein A0H81_13804 [Grifola frondosa]|uniref:Uncharacterized protein n=1 Tax=Grifola frondosa TaxID=5627 RepID=A0A1C7LN49_GRIFR|nr:hypothetical protein A0H81_13804 [Grifola frondosa]